MVIIPLAIMAFCRLRCQEKTRVAVDSAVISLSVGVFVFVLFSLLLPDKFMPWVAVALIATLPAAVIAATTFFYLTRPISFHAREHEFQTLSFLVVIVVTLAVALPYLMVASSLSPNHAFVLANDFDNNVRATSHAQVIHPLPQLLIEQSKVYADELSARARYWRSNPLPRTLNSVNLVYEDVSRPYFGAQMFFSVAQELDQYLLLAQDPVRFAEFEECVLSSPARRPSSFTVPRPTDLEPSRAIFVPNAYSRYVYHSSVYQQGFFAAEILAQAQQDVWLRAIAIAENSAQTQEDMRAIALVRASRERDVNC